MTGPEIQRNQPPEPISELTAVARDTFASQGDFREARRQAAAAAALRNAGVDLEAQFAAYDAQQAGEQLPPPPNDSHH